MVKVTIYKDPDGRYEGFDCTGHARYADVGQISFVREFRPLSSIRSILLKI